MDLGISGKRALVLASSRGLGLGIANALAAEGCHVLLCGRSTEKLKANCDAINAAGKGKADFVEADLSDANFVETMVHAVHDKLGGIDILVNNTGGPTPGTAEDMNAEKLYNFFQSMVVRVITLTNTLLPLMKTQGFGRIVTVASSALSSRSAIWHCPTPARRAGGLEQDAGDGNRLLRYHRQPHSAGSHPHRPDRRTGWRQCRQERQERRRGSRRFDQDYSRRTPRQGRGVRRSGRLPVLAAGELHHRHHASGGWRRRQSL